MKIACVYNEIFENSSIDDMDVINQVKAVTKSIVELDHEVVEIPISLDLKKMVHELNNQKPDVIFNLVESIEGVESYMHFAPAIFEKLNIKYTGGTSENLVITTNKLLTKELMQYYNISTPRWAREIINSDNNFNFPVPCIIKPISEDASVGIDDRSIVRKREEILPRLNFYNETVGNCFLEEFIEGREFNISIMETLNGVVVLPVAEIRFENFPDGKEKIVDYKAKWDDNSFEYNNTVRHFDFFKPDQKLIENLKSTTFDCWNKFKLKGYARIDYRVTSNGNIFALEINSNPCISPDSGFVAAAKEYGWNYTKMVDEIINMAMTSK